MLNRIPTRLLLLLVFCALSAMVGCSDDATTDPGGGGGGGGGDTLAPIVTRLTPDNHESNVEVGQDISVQFSEPVDPGTFADALQISEGAVTHIAWDDSSTSATVSHSDWSEGATVTVTVGTGVTDLAGNALAQVFSTEFYTYSSEAALVAYDFYAPMDDVPLNGFFDLRFSRAMNLNSILSAYTLSLNDGSKDLPGIIVGSVDHDFTRVRVRWDGTLAPQQAYRFEISTDATTLQGDNLAAPIVIDFTTGLDVDETPPYILSTSPVLGSVVDPSLTTITITFSEPVDESTTTPESMAGILSMFMAREPVWNNAGDELTVYLTGPLPAGVRLYAIWGAEEFKDMAGNANAAADSLSFSVSGSPELFPVREDLRIYYNAETDQGGTERMRQTIENIAGDQFERVVMRQTDTGYDEFEEHWYMARSGASVMFRGFREGQSDMMFDPAVNYLPSPLPADWSGSTTVTSDEGTSNLNFTGVLLETYRQYWSTSKTVSTRQYLDNCVVLSIYHEMTPTGSTEVMEDGTDTVYLCPGVGIIAMDSEGHEYDGEVVVDSWESSLFLLGAAVDGRYEE